MKRFLSLISFAYSLNICFAYFGKNDTRNYNELSQSQQAFSDSSIAIFFKENLEKEKNSYKILYSNPFNYCEDFKYKNEPSAANCSAALISEELVLTANHCVRSIDFCQQNFKFVIGFNHDKNGNNAASISENNVYSCANIVAAGSRYPPFSDWDHYSDWAIVKLDRKVTNYNPYEVELNHNKKEKVFTIGYPLGMQKKISSNAKIRRLNHGLYDTDLDVNKGSSGGPVFSLKTRKIIGILTQAPAHFYKDYKLNCHKEDSVSLALRSVFSTWSGLAYSEVLSTSLMSELQDILKP